jgi:branched-chain amino acid transport system substrate-binding protein
MEEKMFQQLVVLGKRSLASGLVLCGIFFATSVSGAPLKVAIVETLSGPQASTGLLYRSATKYGIDLINEKGGWNGEPVQLLEYDNQGGITGASEKVKAAIADGAQIIVQGSSSAVGGQVTEDVRKYNMRNPGNEVLYMNVGSEAMELTGAKAHFHQFRFSPNADIRMKAVIAAMKEAKALGTRVYSMNQNYSWGMDVEKAVVDNASVGGYQVVEKTLHDVNKIQDFSPYVAKIKAANADTVITGNWSNDLLLLMKATQAAGLKVRFGTAFLDQPGNIANAGETALGHYVAQAFNIEAAGKEGEILANDYKGKTGHFPTYVEPQTIFGMAILGEALKNVKPEGGKLGINALVLALEKVKYKGPLGDMSLRTEDHQILLPMVVAVVSQDAKVKVDDTSMGFKPVKVLSATEAAAPVQATCNIVRPN